MLLEYATAVLLILVMTTIVMLINHKRSLLRVQQEDWQDLNNMMSKVYADNDALRNDLQRAAKHVHLLQSVNNNLKNTIDDLSEHKNDLISQMNGLLRALDSFEQEIHALKHPETIPLPHPNDDELDEWDDTVPPSTDLFSSIASAFIKPVSPNTDDE